jgi:UDP-N-acetylglucosamine 2-epimerase (non-hydrolysing)
MPTVAVVLGTRPEAIKLAPVVRELRRHASLRTVVISTGQHREMLDQILGPFGIGVDRELNLMEPGQTLYRLTSRALAAFEEALAALRPDLLLVQGDTSTAFAGALAAFYAKVPVAHVEAGLRTSNRYAPYPEEMNRRLISALAELHFAPTAINRDTLLGEHVAPGSILVTGNTGIDTLLAAVDLSRDAKLPIDPAGRRVILVTAHRRESFGDGLREIFEALRELAAAYPQALVVFPVHLNPNVKGPAHTILGGLPNVVLCEPLDYFPFVRLMSESFLILSDSGGVQEEAPALGVPVLVLRHETERVEAVRAGVVKLVGTSKEAIVRESRLLLDDPIAHHQLARRLSPYGDGRAAQRITAAILSRLGQPAPADTPPPFNG